MIASRWKYISLGVMAVLAVGFSFPQAFAHITNSVSHNVGHILDAIAAANSDIDNIQSDIDSLESDISDIQTSIEGLGANAITVEVVAPAEDLVEVLPFDSENDRMYTGHVNGIMSLTAVGGTSVRINCAVGTSNAPIIHLGRIDSLPTPEFQAIQVDEDFTCTSLSVEYVGANTNGVIVDLAISYGYVDGITEIESP